MPFVVTLAGTLPLLVGLMTILSKAAKGFVPAPSLTAMVAMLYMLVGIAIWAYLLRESGRWHLIVVRGAGLIIVLVSMIAVASNLFREPVPHSEMTRYDRMYAVAFSPLEPATAAAFVMLGSALFWLPSTGAWPSCALPRDC